MANVQTGLGSIFVDDQGPQDGPIAILWPSLFTDHTMWRHQVQALTASGWRTLAIDPPGHGRSDAPLHTFTMDDCADAVLTVLATLRIDEPFVMLGTSWGGFVAPRVALRAPERVRGLLMFNTSAERAPLRGRLKDTLLSKLLGVAALDGLVDRMIVSALLGAESRERNPAIGTAMMRRLRSWDRKGVINTVRSVLVERDSILDALSGVGCPCLVISGAEDRILPTSLSKRMADRLPDSVTVEVPQAAHLVPVERPDEANRLTIDFLWAIQPPMSRSA